MIAQRSKPISTLFRLQSLRAWAAISVMLLHYLPSISKQIPILSLLNDAAQQICFAGVDVFFVISGYIVTRMYYEEGLSAGKYLLKRLVRIFSGYWLILMIFLLLHPLLGMSVGQYRIIKSALLLPPGIDGYPLGVAWSLRYEIVFYALFALAAGTLSRRLFRSALYLAIPLTFIFFGAYCLRYTGPLDFAVNPFLLEFMAGTALFFMGEQYGRWGQWLGSTFLVAAGIINYEILNTHLVHFPQRVLRVLLLLPGAFALVAWAIQENPRPRSLSGRCIVRMGDASYMLYLVHIPVGIITLRLLGQGAWEIILPIEALGVAWLLHAYAERPLYKFCRRLLAL